MTTAMNSARTSVPRRRGRPALDADHAVPEERILLLAFRTFAEKGYEGTTVRNLAKQLGVSHNLLNVRFGTKAELWKRAVDARVAEASKPVLAAFDAPGLQDEQRLRVLIARFCRWTADHPHLVGMTNVEGRRDTWRLDYIVNAYVMPFKQRLDALLDRVREVRPVASISTSALMSLLVQGVGFFFASAAMQTRIDRESAPHAKRVEAQSQAFAEFILAGLLPPIAVSRSPGGAR